MLPRERRLTKAYDFDAVARQGRTWRASRLLVRARVRDSGQTRFGLAVSKGVGNAVTRNRVKRRLREILRRLPVYQGWDILVSAHRQTAFTDYHALEREVTTLFQKASLSAPGDSRSVRDGG